MIDPLALALREIRGSANTEAAGHIDAEDADTLRRILARLGWALVPVALDAEMRRAIWQAQAEHLVQTPATRAAYTTFRLTNDQQHALDRAAWSAIHAEVARRLGDG